VATPAAGRPKTHAQNHRVPYSLHMMLRNTAHFAILKVIGDRFPEMTTRSSLWSVSDSVPLCFPLSVIHAPFLRLLGWQAALLARSRTIRRLSAMRQVRVPLCVLRRDLLPRPSPLQPARRQQDARVSDHQGE